MNPRKLKYEPILNEVLCQFERTFPICRLPEKLRSVNRELDTGAFHRWIRCV